MHANHVKLLAAIYGVLQLLNAHTRFSKEDACHLHYHASWQTAQKFPPEISTVAQRAFATAEQGCCNMRRFARSEGITEGELARRHHTKYQKDPTVAATGSGTI